MRFTSLQRGMILFGWLAATMFGSSPAEVFAIDLYSQNFDGLTLKPVVTFDSELRDRSAWTNVPPAGWTVDSSATATFGNPNSGAKEFEGWTFVKKDWWIATSGDQDRGKFASASGIVAVADPDEWDDFPSNDPTPDELGVFDSKLTSPPISLSGIAANQAKVFFYSSWRDEDTQQATLTARYNTGASVELLRWDSRKMIDNGLGGEIPNAFFKDDAPNEGLTFDLKNPAGASSVQLEFRVFEAKNDWWWAFDNLQVFTGAAPSADGALRAIIDRETGQVKIVNRTGEAVNIRGYSIRSSGGAFDEASASFLSMSDPNWLKGTRLGDPANDLSEVHLTSGVLADLAEINFGNVWRKFYREEGDVNFQYLVDGSDQPIQGILEFTGNNDKEFDFLDLNYNGEIEIGDWLKFKDGFSQSLVNQPEVVRHNLGDLNNDKLHTAADFLEFKSRYVAANGEGAFALAIAGVPEPSSALLAGITLLGATFVRRRGGHRSRSCLYLLAAVVVCGGYTPSAQAQLKIFTEDFENLPLGPNVQETVVGEEVWTNTPPTGWTIDNSGIPGFGNPATNGVDEWAGWSFADKAWWAKVDNQGRSEFSRGQGTVMIADPDEWDDDSGAEQQARRQIATAPTPDNFYDSFATTRVINIPAGIPAGRLKLSFDSSWLPEGFDDLDETNNQTATVKVRYNNGPKTEILRWDSDDDPDNPLFHEGNTNERVSGLDLKYNGTSTTMQLEFGLGNAWNDWWWAIDNLSVEVPADPSVVRIDTKTGRGFLVGGDIISTTINSISIGSELGQLRGSSATGLSGAPNMERVDGNDGDAISGNSPGEQWEKLDATNNQIFEAFLFGESTFTNSRSVDLGVIFNTTTPAAARDVSFTYTTGTGDAVTGVVQYFESAGVLGDYNNNGVVDAADYTLWRNYLGTNQPLPNQGATPGQITQQDYAVWKAHFGESIAGAGANSVATVPEPATTLLLALAAFAIVIPRQASSWRRWCSICAGVGLLLSCATLARAETLDRDYRFGNNDPGAVAGGFVNTTFDSAGALGMNQLTDLAAVGGIGQQPRYVSITDRPDGVSGLGIRLNQFGGEKQYLKTGFGEALNFPERSPASTYTPGGTIDYSYVSDRGFQLWAKPTVLPAAGARADVVMDSNQHGVSINSAGKFVMRYAYADYVSTKSATANTWFHLSVVRPFGPGSGSILYVNGEAVAAALGEYNIERVANAEGVVVDQNKLDTSPLTVGANTGIGNTEPDPRPPTLAPGTTNYFQGIVDDLEMFVMGLNRTRDFGEYEFQFDNDYAAFKKPLNPIDLTNDNAVTFADAQAFASNWLFENELKWVDPLGEDRSLIVGDLVSRSKGDFNFDGRVNLADWAMLNSASSGIGAAAMALINGTPIPEPATALLAFMASFAVGATRRRRAKQKVAGGQHYCAFGSRGSRA